MKITQSSFGPLLQLFSQTAPIRNKLKILKGNKIAPWAFRGDNFTKNMLHAFKPMVFDL